MYTYFKIFDSISSKYIVGKNLKTNIFGDIFYSKEIANEWMEHFNQLVEINKLYNTNNELKLSIVEFFSEEQLIIFDFSYCKESLYSYIEGSINSRSYNRNDTLFVDKNLSNYIINEHQGLINSCKIYLPFSKLTDEEIYLSTDVEICIRKVVEYYNLKLSK